MEINQLKRALTKTRKAGYTTNKKQLIEAILQTRTKAKISLSAKTNCL